MLVSDKAAFTPRPPPPATLFTTNFKPTWCINRRPGSSTGIARSPGAVTRFDSVHRVGDVERWDVLSLGARSEGAMYLVNRVDDADDGAVRGLVVSVEDRLVKLLVRRIAVRPRDLPLGLDLGCEIGKANDLHVPLLLDHVLPGDIHRTDDRPRLLPDQDELVRGLHLDVKLFLRLQLRRLGGTGWPGDLRVGIQARHVAPDCRDEEEGDRHH